MSEKELPETNPDSDENEEDMEPEDLPVEIEEEEPEQDADEQDEGELDEDGSNEDPLEVRLSQLVDFIRQSSYNGELVKLDQLEYGEDLREEEQEELQERLLALEEIKRLEGKSGRVYLYSSALMVDRYANLVLQREENDPKQLVADTVREESKLYPRPTKPDVFLLPPFKIPEPILDALVQELVEDEGAYGDIQEAEASNGVKYLYSTKHMDKQHAQYLTEWYEVEINENQ